MEHISRDSIALKYELLLDGIKREKLQCFRQNAPGAAMACPDEYKVRKPIVLLSRSIGNIVKINTFKELLDCIIIKYYKNTTAE